MQDLDSARHSQRCERKAATRAIVASSNYGVRRNGRNERQIVAAAWIRVLNILPCNVARFTAARECERRYRYRSLGSASFDASRFHASASTRTRFANCCALTMALWKGA
jgi:hypothetical protein